MTLISLLLSIALVGCVCWLILQIPMPQAFRNLIVAVAVIALILWLLQGGGVVVPGLRIR